MLHFVMAMISRRHLSKLYSPLFLCIPFVFFGIIGVLFLFVSQHKSATQPSLYVYEKIDEPVRGCPSGNVTDPGKREKAAFLSLTRNEDLDDLLPTLATLERKFNNRFRYPYVFLSDPIEPLTSEFKLAVTATLGPEADIRWGVVPEEHWRIPEWLDEKEVNDSIVKQGRWWTGILYGGRIGYHHMCRFYSGLHARHPLLQEFDYYWRTEGTANFFCDFPYDPFRYMAENKKIYGFNMILKDIAVTIPTLWPHVQSWQKQMSLPKSGLMGMMEKKSMFGKIGYTRCHFWNNFEIVDLRFLRSKQYQDYFDVRQFCSLPKLWGQALMIRENTAPRPRRFRAMGDAPVRSLAVAMMLQPEQVHYFEDIGYQHDNTVNCPRGNRPGRENIGCNCECPEDASYQEGNTDWSCDPLWDQINRRPITA